MFEDIKKHNMAVAEQIQKGFSNADELMKALVPGTVRVVNGKTYVDTEYAPGKFDWRIVHTETKDEVQNKYDAAIKRKSALLTELKKIGSDLIQDAVKESKSTYTPEYGEKVVDAKEISDFISENLWEVSDVNKKYPEGKTAFDYVWDKRIAPKMSSPGLFSGKLKTLKGKVKSLISSDKKWSNKQGEIAIAQGQIEKYGLQLSKYK